MSVSVNAVLFSQPQLCQWEMTIPQGKVGVHWDVREDGWVKLLRLSTTSVCKSLLFWSSRQFAQLLFGGFIFLIKAYLEQAQHFNWELDHIRNRMQRWEGSSEPCPLSIYFSACLLFLHHGYSSYLQITAQPKIHSIMLSLQIIYC